MIDDTAPETTPETPDAATAAATAAKPEAPPDCPRCGKRPALCICADIEARSISHGLLILQHPQEQDKDLGTARLTCLHVADSVLKVGLSWPNLEKAYGKPADPRRWAVLYLGSDKAEAILPGAEIVVMATKGEAADNQERILADLDGLILLDGSWSQAKTLWWRNAWLMKCQRLILNPKAPSRYGQLRREPRPDGLSTLEAAAIVLSRLERKPAIGERLNDSFTKLLEKYRAVQGKPPRKDWRRKKRR